MPLKSGGYMVINQTEALVAIDVNSGRATRERNIEATALKTNMEAAEEAARQLRLRDLAGLIVIDFIDMEEPKNNRAVEKKLKDSLNDDRARVQMGKISAFGLMDFAPAPPHRRAGGHHPRLRALPGRRPRAFGEIAALALLRALDETAAKNRNRLIEARAPTDVALYLLNEKREALATLEANRKVRLRVTGSSQLTPPDFELNVGDRGIRGSARGRDRSSARRGAPRNRSPRRGSLEPDVEEAEEEEERKPKPPPQRRCRKRRRTPPQAPRPQRRTPPARRGRRRSRRAARGNAATGDCRRWRRSRPAAPSAAGAGAPSASMKSMAANGWISSVRT